MVPDVIFSPAIETPGNPVTLDHGVVIPGNEVIFDHDKDEMLLSLSPVEPPKV